jgi:hypothetical protein
MRALCRGGGFCSGGLLFGGCCFGVAAGLCVLCNGKLAAGTKSSLFVAGCYFWNRDSAVLRLTARAPTRRAVTFSASPDIVPKKGRLLLERSKSFFMPGTAGAASRCVPTPREVRWSRRMLQHRRTQGRSLSGAKDLGKAVCVREVRWGCQPEGRCCYDRCRML